MKKKYNNRDKECSKKSESEKTNIAIYTQSIFTSMEFEHVVSGHNQFAVKTAEILAQQGFRVHIYTTSIKKEYIAPSWVPAEASIRLLTHLHSAGHSKLNSIISHIKKIIELRRYLKEDNAQIIHGFGGHSLAVIFCFLRIMHPRITLIITPVPDLEFPEKRGWLQLLLRLAWRSSTRILCTAPHILDQGKEKNLPVNPKIARPGLFKKMIPNQHGPRNTVLFWRNPDRNNGADIAIEVFARIAKKYENINFVFAVRPGPPLIEDMETLSATYLNVKTYVFPYSEGITIEKLLSQSMLVLLPFRKLSINPQMAILESLGAGVPVLTTRIGGTPDIIIDGEIGRAHV